MRSWRFAGILLLLGVLALACSLTGDSTSELKATIAALETGPRVGATGLPPDGPLGTGGPTSAGNGVGRELELVSQFGGSSRALATDGGSLFVGQGPRVVAVDVSRPGQPVLISTAPEVLPGMVEELQLAGRTLYAVTSPGGLASFDASDPRDLRLLDQVQPEVPSCTALSVAGPYAYLACLQGVVVIDISDPADLRQVGASAESGPKAAIEVIGDYAYVADTTAQGLAVYDLSDPSSPRQVRVITTAGSQSLTAIDSIAPCRDSLCLAGFTFGLALFDLADPAAPNFRGSYPLPTASGLVFLDNWVYVADDQQGVVALDISDPGDIRQAGLLPAQVGGWELGSIEMYERPLISFGQRLYLADPVYGVFILNAADPGALSLLGQYMTPAPELIEDIAVRDGFAYLAARHAGFRVLDVTDPRAIREVYYDDRRKDLYLQTPTALVLAGNYAHLSDSNYPYHAYDISDPTHPQQVGAIFDAPASDGAYDLALSGQYAYLSGWGLQDAFYPGNGLWVLDVSDPGDPRAVAFIDLPNERWSLAVREGVLYALDGGVDEDDPGPLSLRTFDLTDPADPSPAAQIAVPLQPLSPSDLVLAGDRLAASLFSAGTFLYGLGDPLQPQQAASLPGAAFTPSAQLDYSAPYLVLGGEMLYDLSAEAPPGSAAFANQPAAWTADTADGYLFVATSFQGIYVYRLP